MGDHNTRLLHISDAASKCLLKSVIDIGALSSATKSSWSCPGNADDITKQMMLVETLTRHLARSSSWENDDVSGIIVISCIKPFLQYQKNF